MLRGPSDPTSRRLASLLAREMPGVVEVRFNIPVVEEWPGTLVAVSLGGAIVPASLAGCLIVHKGLGWQALMAVAIVSGLVHRLAPPHPGSWHRRPPWCRRSSSPGCSAPCSGRDVLNLRRARALGAPVVSIGGAGTFDGIYLTGVIAVLLVSL